MGRGEGGRRVGDGRWKSGPPLKNRGRSVDERGRQEVMVDEKRSKDGGKEEGEKVGAQQLRAEE